MESYERMEQDMCEFKKYIKMTNDLLVDAYKWKKLSEYADDENSINKYKQISSTLFDMFMQEHESMKRMFKGE